MKAMTTGAQRDERLGNWLALLALLAGSVVFAPPGGAAHAAGHAQRCAGPVTGGAITMR